MPSLDDKLTTKEAVEPFGYANQLGTVRNKHARMPWWLNREWLRIERGAYPEPTEVVTALNQIAPQFALHVSKEDPAYIAYTPDKASGEADRQLRTTLGKFIAKYYPHYPDEVVSEMVGEHMGELTAELEIITGQALVDVYKGMSGAPGSCMVKSFAGLDGHHPAEVYDAPNIGMAVLRDKGGNITARSLVYTPSETDKRYIRVYTDPRLTKLLTKNGYKPGCWWGAEFKTIKLKNGNTLVPYLDGNGQMGGTDRSYVALLDGKLTSVSGTLRNELGRLGFNVPSATLTSGYLYLEDIPSSAFEGTCELTGEKYNKLKDTCVLYCRDGKILQVLEKALPEGSLWLDSYIDERVKTVYCPADTPHYLHRSREFVDNAVNRAKHNYLKLDPRYYPEEQEWVLYSEWDTAYKKGAGGLLKVADCVSLIVVDDSGPKALLVHNEELPKGSVKVHSRIKGELLYAASNVKIDKTPTGRKVVIGVHSVTRLWNGIVEFDRNVKFITVLGKRVAVARDQGAVDYTTGVGAHVLIEQLEAGEMDEDAVYLVSRYIDNDISWAGTRIERWRSDPKVKWEDCYDAVLASRNFQWISASSKALLGAINRYVVGRKAEMNAIDYNGQHDPSMNTCEEVSTSHLEKLKEPFKAISAEPWPFVGGTGSSTTMILPTGSSMLTPGLYVTNTI